MTHIDQSSGELVIRIVYDGVPEAGKTTNINSLSSQIALRRRSSVTSPHSHGRRTEYFDWLDFSGGFIDGKRVRCQLVSVPGQPQLLHRRSYLLERADVVVYVADSRPERLDEGRENLARCRKILDRLGLRIEIGLVVQANKQDLPGALSAEELARCLELPAHVAVVPSVASNGNGVMQTFILAARVATDRARAMLGSEAQPELAEAHETPNTLYAAMTALEPVKRSPRPNECPTTFRAPDDLELRAEDVWPPVKGRGLLGRASLNRLSAPPLLAPWAPHLAFELGSDSGWTLHTAERWQFADAELARQQLRELVREQRRWGGLLFQGRVAFLVTDDDGAARVWAVTAPTTLLETWLERILLERDTRGLEGVADLIADFERRALKLGDLPRLDLSELCLSHGRLATLRLENSGLQPFRRGQLAVDFRVRALQASSRDGELQAWLEAHSAYLPS
jgi:signal recognition particle receptor subunit beta